MKLKNLLFMLAITLISFIGISNVKAVENYGLWVNGEEFTSDKLTIDCGSGTATYDPSTLTLTLNNATINNTKDSVNLSYPTGSYPYKTITLVLSGTNTINSSFKAIKAESNLTITGTGTLNINISPTVSSISNDTDNVDVSGDLIIENSTINMTIAKNSIDEDTITAGISSIGMTLTNANISITGVINTGISAWKDLVINSSKIDITHQNKYYFNNYSSIGIEGRNVTINGASDIDISRFHEGITTNGTGTDLLTINDGDITILAESVLSVGQVTLVLDNYNKKIAVSNMFDGEDVFIIDKEDLEDCYQYYYLRMGDFDTYTITNETTDDGITMVEETLAGTTVWIHLDDSRWLNSKHGYNEYIVYEIENVKIYRASDNADVTSAVKYNAEYHEFIMPKYDVIVKADLVKEYNAKLKSASVKLATYNSAKVSWVNSDPQTIAGTNDGYNVYYRAEGYNWAFLGSTKNSTITKKNMLQGKKYYFKIVPYITVYRNKNGNTETYKEESLNYKIVSLYTLKKMNLPTVTKYNNSKVQVKWKKVEGATKYQIARSVYTSRNYSIVKTVSSGYIGFKLNTKANKTYYYKVRACNGNVCGPWSNYRSFRLK